MPDIVSFKDKEGRWLDVSSVAKNTFQLSGMSWQGKTNLELIELHPHLRETLLACNDSDEVAWQKGNYHDYEETIADTVGDRHTFSMRKVPLYETNGEPCGMLVTGRDITETRKAFEEILHAKELAEQASKAKSQFLGRMSHELRTPLNAILGFAQLLEIQSDETTMAETRDSVREIVASGWYLVRIINDLLDLAAIEANKIEMQIKAVELDASISDCIKVMEPLANDRDVVINYEPTPCCGMGVLADSFRLKQVLLNLLSNAVKYNRKGGEVNVLCVRRPPDNVRIKVVDNGSGIPEADLPRIFEAFGRLNKRAYAVEGAGIGLSIAKHLVELMDGTVGVESVEGEGSTFWIEFREVMARHSAQVSSLIESTEQGSEPEKMVTLLYIEDSPSHVSLMETILNDIGNIDLLTAHTPVLGLELADAHKPDIILSDICLPGMDGYELLEKIKANPRTSHIPVIAISANAMASEVEAGLLAGFRRYFTKPINVVEFRKALRELLDDEAVLPDK